MKKCPYCAEDVQDEAIKCIYCGELLVENKKNTELKGLGGWLIVVIIGLITTPFNILNTLNDVYVTMLNDGSLAQFITPSSGSYIEWFLPLSIFEFSGNFIFIIFSSILIHLFFAKYKYFPLIFKIYLVSYFVFVSVDYILPEMLPELSSVEDDNWQYLLEVIRAFIYMIIWFSYMHFSKRVKNTFIENDYKNKNVGVIILLIIIILSILGLISTADFSKLSFNEYEYGNNTCVEKYGINSYYNGEQDEKTYLCECKEGYEFGGKDKETCVIIKK